jgi:glutaconate CoA-transferase subunit A
MPNIGLDPALSAADYPDLATASPDRVKLTTAADAVSRFVQDGDSIYAGYTQVPHALAYEIIRQGRRRLEGIAASAGIQMSHFIMAGCMDRVRSGYIGGALRPGLISEKMASGELKFEDYSNGAIAMMLMAGAYGLPFVPMKWFLGTDYLKPENIDHPAAFLGQEKWKVIESPFDGEKFVALPAIKPNITIMHFQRADVYGNVQGWGALGDARFALWAAERVVVSVEEIVPTEVIGRSPNLTLVPGARVSAVVHEPWGAHPTHLSGYYDYDYPFIAATGIAGTSQEGWDAYRAEWIDAVPSRAEYMAHLRDRFGEASLANITPIEDIEPVEPISYGFAPHLAWPTR